MIGLIPAREPFEKTFHCSFEGIQLKDLIEALQIFLKYSDEEYPTHCEHDVLMVIGIDEDQVSEEDKARLDELGFFWSDEHDCWSSFKFGSA